MYLTRPVTIKVRHGDKHGVPFEQDMLTRSPLKTLLSPNPRPQVQRMDDGGTPIGEDGQRIFDRPVEAENGAAEQEDGGWL
mmetsp:Transcript_19055/g.34591  ORF Transcript_19055/g.34591 Transcript_19055/m.34591 type:complete len:81 (-) Transcript_19055:289-531(-)